MEILNIFKDKENLIFLDRVKKYYIRSAKHLLEKSAINISSEIKLFCFRSMKK